MMKKIAMIPARYAATRFPQKLMQPLGNKTVILQTHDRTVATGLFDAVYVVTDHEIIFEEISKHGGLAIMSQQPHESGSDRIAEAIADMDIEIVVNVQGDEPFVQKNALQNLLHAFNAPEGLSVQVASLMKKMTDPALIQNPNYVKLVLDQHQHALYFSRSPIPFYRSANAEQIYYEHVGVYAYRKEALLNFTRWPMGSLEQAEKLEQLRYLEHGVNIKMIETFEETIKIDVPEDLEKATQYLNSLSEIEASKA